MARAISDIQNQIISNLAVSGIVVSNNMFSRRRIWTYVIAVCHWITESNVDSVFAEINETIANKTPHLIQYYVNLVKAFQYGSSLVNGAYDNTGLTDAEIEDLKIVKYCSIKKQGRSLAIKIAKANGNDLQKLNNGEFAALIAYLKVVMDAGVFYTVINEDADSLKLNATVYVNPMLINGIGVSISSGKPEIENTLIAYLNNLPFNGVFSLQDLIDAMQKVNGVRFFNPTLTKVKSDASSTYQDVEVLYYPASGYLRFINQSVDLNLNIIPYAD